MPRHAGRFAAVVLAFLLALTFVLWVLAATTGEGKAVETITIGRAANPQEPARTGRCLRLAW